MVLAVWSPASSAIFDSAAHRDAAATPIDGIRVGMPVFGKIWLKYQVALFARTLSTLLTGGLPLVPSLETAARSISSRTRRQGRLHVHRHRARRQKPRRLA